MDPQLRSKLRLNLDSAERTLGVLDGLSEAHRRLGRELTEELWAILGQLPEEHFTRMEWNSAQPQEPGLVLPLHPGNYRTPVPLGCFRREDGTTALVELARSSSDRTYRIQRFYHHNDLLEVVGMEGIHRLIVKLRSLLT